MYYVYKHLDKDNNVIYVGQTTNIHGRQTTHKSKSKWRKEISKIEYSEVTDKLIMNIYEKFYISKFNPKYNKKDLDCKYSEYFYAMKELDFKEYIYNKEELINKRVYIKRHKIKFHEAFESYYNNVSETIDKMKSEFGISGYVIENRLICIGYEIPCLFYMSYWGGSANISKHDKYDRKNKLFYYYKNSNDLNLNEYNHLKTPEQLAYKSLDELWSEITK